MNKSDKNNDYTWVILLQLSRAAESGRLDDCLGQFTKINIHGDVFYQIGKYRVSGSLIEQIKIIPEYYQQVALLELDKCDILNAKCVF